MKAIIFATTAAAVLAAPILAEPVTYEMDPPHTQIVFTWNHFGFTRTMGFVSGIEGEIIFDREDPAKSSVSAHFPTTALDTGWERRNNTFASEEFFNAEAHPEITFKSTSITVTGVDTGNIHGELTARGVTVPVTLHAEFTGEGMNPVYKTPAIGFTATAKLLRSDFGIDRLIPMMGDEIELKIVAEGIIPTEEES